MNRKTAIETALGRQKPDLVLRNGRIVNVFTGEILSGDIAIKDGFVVAVGSYEGGIDLEGRTVIPGMIDAHCHVESSMVTPPVYAGEAVKWGTTTLITDPHEITNVAGSAGVQFMLDASADLPVNYFIQLPSCVPATPFEHAGAEFTADKMAPFKGHPRVSGLGELMNYPGVAACDPEVLAKLALFEGEVIDGHAPDITGNDLQAYVCAGVKTDHESIAYAQAREKLQAGVAVLVREGSACKNLRPIIEGVLADGLDTTQLAFCTDDKHLSDIRKEGTIRFAVKYAISLGMKPVTAIQMATINPARIYRLREIGAIAPGYRADLVVLDNLEEMIVHSVYKDGILISREDNGIDDHANCVSEEKLIHSVNLKPLRGDAFQLPHQDRYPVIQIMPGNVTTTKSWVDAADVEDRINAGSLRKIAVIERHHATGYIGVGLIEGYGLTRGAVATTVVHDSHNLIVVGDNDADMRAAVAEIARVQGGYTILRNGQVLGTLPLPVCGLMTSEPAECVISALDDMLKIAREAGVAPGIDPFITLSFMALPVIPEIRITDMGVFDVTQFAFIK